MFLVANTLSGGISILSATEYNALCSNTYTTDLLRSFRKQGFIVPNETNELEIVNKTRIAACTSNDNKACSYRIYTCTACNASCAYCFEKDMKPQYMKIATQNDVFNYIISHINHAKRLNITWFGGEPLLAPSVIERLTFLLDNKLSGENVETCYSIVTNGSLITKDLAEKIANKWHISVVQITLDGYEKYYNNVKQYSLPEKYNYKSVISGIHELLAYPNVEVQLRINYTPNSINEVNLLLDHIFEEFSSIDGTIDSHLHPYVFPIWDTTERKGNIEYGISSKDDDAYIDLCSRLVKMGVINWLDIMRLGLKDRHCGAMTMHGLSFLPDGSIIKCCEAYKESVVGTAHHGITTNNKNEYWGAGIISSHCEECVLLPMCQGGCLASQYSNMPTCIASKNSIKKLLYKYADSKGGA